MPVTKSIRDKLFLLLLAMGALPFVMVIVFNARDMINAMELGAQRDGLLRNSIISEHVTELIDKNFKVLNQLALNPQIDQYLRAPNENLYQPTLNLLHDTNTICHDRNMTALTTATGMQLLRTDGSQLVNISDREHFKEAMRGHSFVSNVIVSRSTGQRIIVMEVPVRDRHNHVIGMLQRNFDLSALHKFLSDYDTEDITVIIIDRQGNTVAHSRGNQSFEGEYYDENRYEYLADKMSAPSGILHLSVDDKDALASYSRNLQTDWIIITVQPYDFIKTQVNSKILESMTIGILMLSIVCIAAYFIAGVATRPIIQITDVATKIVKGNKDIEKLEINADDELGQMVEAFNKIRSARDAFQIESELDKLTRLYNKSTTESIGKLKLKNFKEIEQNDTLMAMYVIDLDHFKDANDVFGHQFGDKVLLEFSRQLRKRFRPNDCIGRFGGDEFVVIIDNLPHMGIVLRKARDIKKVASELEIDGHNVGITASIGIAIVPQDGLEYSEVFKAADEALYHVKAHGRNGFYYNGADSVG